MQPDSERLSKIFVGDPVDRNGRIMYTVRAFDSKGSFEVQRSFSQFEALRKSFTQRLPGVYIPKLPKGNFFGTKDIKFLQERAFHCEQFLKKVLRLQYLLQSGELQVFSRPDAELRDREGNIYSVEKQLELLPQ